LIKLSLKFLKFNQTLDKFVLLVLSPLIKENLHFWLFLGLNLRLCSVIQFMQLALVALDEMASGRTRAWGSSIQTIFQAIFAADWSSLDVCIRIQIEDELLWLLGENFVVLCTIWVSCVELASEYSMQLTILKTNLVHD
jgi:hypothetical protein